MRYVHLYNTTLPQSALMSPTPMQAMKDWHKSHPHIFVKTPRNRPGRDRYGQRILLVSAIIWPSSGSFRPKERERQRYHTLNRSNTKRSNAKPPGLVSND